jgi:hypothetical protein
MRSAIHPSKGTIMTETPETVVSEAVATEPPPEKQPNRLQRFVNTHPRAAKAAAITLAAVGVTGTVQFARTVKANRQHLEQASDAAKETLSELAATVDPAQSDPEA